MNVHVTRRAILDALKDYGRAPVDVATVKQHLVGDEAREAAQEQLDMLIALGYVENAYNAANPRYRITGDGLRQLAQTARELDVEIWGELAL